MKEKKLLIRKIFDENVWLMSALAKRLWIKPPTVHITASWKRKVRLDTKKRYTEALNIELETNYGFMELFEEVKEKKTRKNKKNKK